MINNNHLLYIEGETENCRSFRLKQGGLLREYGLESNRRYSVSVFLWKKI